MGTSRRRWLTDQEQRVWRAYVLGQAQLLAELNGRLAARAGLSIADYEVLVHLSEAAEGRLRVFELRNRMQWERTRLSHHLSRMERRDLIEREDCETDARGAFITMTDHGAAALKRAAPGHAADVRQLFLEPVGPDLGALDRLSRRILGAQPDLRPQE